MAVRADDIALVRLGTDAFPAGVRDHPRDGCNFGAWIAVVEFHGARRKSTAAVDARNVAKLIEQIGVVPPPVALSIDPRPLRLRGTPPSQALTMLLSSPNAVAVRAHDITLRSLNKQICPVLQQRFGERESLLRRVSVVKGHLHWMESSPAVGARAVSQLAKKRSRGSLSSGDPFDLAFSVCCVPAHVGVSLAGSRAHDLC